MKHLRRFAGIIWMILGPITIFVLVRSAFINITATGNADINQPIPWIIIIAIFTPIAAGLTIFGWYVWKGEYD